MLTVTKVTTVVAAFCIHFVTHGIVYSFGVLFIVIDNLFEASKADIAWIGSIATALLFLCGPVTGYLTSRFGCRIVAVTGAVVGFLGYGVSLFVSNLYVLYITMGFVAGCGFGLIYLPAVTSVTRTFSKYRTLAVGLSFCGAGIGGFVFSPLQNVLLETYAWQGTLLINAGLILNCAPFALLLHEGKSRDTPIKRRKEKTSVPDKYVNNIKEVESTLLGKSDLCCEKDEHFVDRKPSNGYVYRECQTATVTNGDVLPEQTEKLAVPEHSHNVQCYNSERDAEVVIENDKAYSAQKVSFMTNLTLMKEPIFVLVITSQFLYYVGVYLPFIYLPDRMKTLGMDESSGAWTVSTIGISSIIGRIALSYVIDRLTIDRTRFMSCALLVGGLVTSLVPVFVPLWSLVLYAVAYGICLGVTVTLLPCVLVDLLGIAKINETLGMTNLFCGTASLIGPPFAGLLFDLTRNYDATFMAAGATQVLAGAMLLFAPLLKNR